MEEIENHISRRDFLKLSGFGSLAYNPTLALIESIFAPNIQGFLNHLHVMGIVPEGDTPGVHLRWMFPIERGFPRKFEIYRQLHNKNLQLKKRLIFIPEISSHSQFLPLNYKFDIVALSNYSQRQFRFKNKACNPKEPNKREPVIENTQYRNEALQIDFNSTVIDVVLDFCSVTLPFKIEAYNNDSLVAEIIVEKPIVQFGSVEITKLKITMLFDVLKSIEYTDISKTCGEIKGQLIKTINIITEKGGVDILKSRIENGISNYYYSNQAETLKSFERKEDWLISSLISLTQESLAPLPQVVVIPKVQLLMMLAMNPAIARMLGLYFVDTTIDKKSAYDYKVVAIYPNKIEICGVLQNIGDVYSKKPLLNGILEAKQIRPSKWEIDNEYNIKTLNGKIALNWQKPDYEGLGGLFRFTEPILYGVSRKGKIDDDTIKRLEFTPPKRIISVSPDVWLKNKAPFTDRNVELARFAGSNPQESDFNKEYFYDYEVVGIDIFGQASNPLSVRGVNPKNTESPPSAINLEIISLPDTTKKLQFEYGAYQYLQAPDIKEFKIYKKLPPLVDTWERSFTVNSRFMLNDEEFSSQSILQTNLTTDVFGDFYKLDFVKQTNGQPLAAADRAHLIGKGLGSNQIQINVPNEVSIPATGLIQMSHLPDSIIGWESYPIIPVQALQPQILTITDYSHFISIHESTTLLAKEADLNTQSDRCFGARILKSRRTIPKVDIQGNLTSNEQVTELFIDRFLIHNGLFDNGQIKINSDTYSILYQTTGVIYDASDIDLPENISKRNNYVRVAISENISQIDIAIDCKLIPPKNIIKPPDSNSEEEVDLVNILSGLINLKISGQTTIQKGGEFLLWGLHEMVLPPESQPEPGVLNLPSPVSEPIQIIGRLISDIKPEVPDVLVFIDKPIKRVVFDESFPIENEVPITISNKVPYFAPYQAVIIIENPADNEADKINYFRVGSTDFVSNAGILSSPRQYKQIKETKPMPPTQPYLCDDVDKLETQYYISEPDLEGKATVKICWDIPIGGTYLKYEVGRTLDVTLETVHRSLWWQQEVETSLDDDIIIESIQLNSIIITFDTNTGLFNASINIDTFNGIDYKKFIGGRLIVGELTIEDKSFYQITNIQRFTTDFKLILRGKEGYLTGTKISIESKPDYKAILDNDENLRLFSNEEALKDAFKLATVVPLEKNEFRDKLDGKGDNRFLYKVRSIDAAGNRSVWSSASVPFYQADTDNPEAPQITYIEGQEQQAYIKWRNEEDNKIIGYRLFRTNKKLNKDFPSDYLDEKLIKTLVKSNPQNNEALVGFSKIRIRYNQVEIPIIEELKNPNNRITGIYRLNDVGEPDTTVNYFISNATSLVGQTISNIPPEIKEGIEVVVVLNSTTNTEVVIYSDVNGNLRTLAGQIQLPALQNINSQSPIKGIFIIEGYKFGQTVENQLAKNYNTSTTTQFFGRKRLLKNIYSGLVEGTAVAIQITKSDGTTLILKEDQTEYEYTDDLKDTLTLDLFYNYRLDTIKDINFTSPATKIYSLKSNDAMVQIKMNTSPAIPEIESVEWWDWENNRLSGINTVSYALRIYPDFISKYTRIRIFLSTSSNAPYFEIAENNLIKTIIEDRVENITIKVQKKQIFNLKITLANQWGKYSETNKMILL